MKFKDTKYGDLTGQNYKKNIDVSDMKITSLEGAPQIVQGNFDCNNNNLTSLEGAPELVNRNFYCQQNSLVSLRGLKVTNITSMYCGKNLNKYLNKEWEIRKENPKMSEEDINIKMNESTQSNYYLSQAAKDIFLF